MQASAGGGISGAATRVAGPEFLSPRERPENLCMERVLRERDGLGFCRSSLAGRRLNPTPELSFQYKERDRERGRFFADEVRGARGSAEDTAVVVISESALGSQRERRCA